MIQGYVDGIIPDYQMSAWLMALYFNHMNDEERYNLTMTMLESGDIVSLSEINGKKIDKHSTGGVGDKTTLSLSPMVASLGLKVSKLSGRGLGHTGGTIDKLDAIKGFRTDLSKEEFFEIANKTGVVVAGQTSNIAPADKKIYSLRDATATVDEISLISASIMSKKLAVESDGIVLDVKAGSGAFMKSIEEAKILAESMCSIAKMNGKNVIALVTNMNQPLGNMVGNSLEVLEAIKTVKGEGPKDFYDLCVQLSAYMAELSGDFTYEQAKKRLEENIKNGTVKEIMKNWIKAQGGNEDIVENPEKHLDISKEIIHFKAEKDGVITKINTEKCGLASMVLGAGRSSKEDTIDLSVGIEFNKKLGESVLKNDIIATLYISEKSDVQNSLNLLKEAFQIDKDSEVFSPELIHAIIK